MSKATYFIYVGIPTLDDGELLYEDKIEEMELTEQEVKDIRKAHKISVRKMFDDGANFGDWEAGHPEAVYDKEKETYALYFESETYTKTFPVWRVTKSEPKVDTFGWWIKLH